jgi:hypothetical protein
MCFLADQRHGRLRVRLPDLFGGLVSRHSTTYEQIPALFHMLLRIRDAPAEFIV